MQIYSNILESQNFLTKKFDCFFNYRILFIILRIKNVKILRYE